MNSLERFWSKVDRSAGPDACWPWLGARFGKGYGVFQVDGKAVRAHRWIVGRLAGGELPVGDCKCKQFVVAHSCDNPPCCNPAHLAVVTQAENIRDSITKGRHSSAALAGATECSRGHAFDDDNTIRTSEGWRKCRTCQNDAQRQRRVAA